MIFFFPKVSWQEVFQIKRASEHICHFTYNEKNKEIEILVGTTIYKNQPFPKFILHNAYSSEFEYNPGKFQGFAERKLVFSQVDLTKEELVSLQMLLETNNDDKTNKTIENIEKGLKTFEFNLLKNTNGNDLLKASKKMKALRNDLEFCKNNRNQNEIVKFDHKIISYPEGFNYKTTPETLKMLKNIQTEYTAPANLNYFKLAIKMQEQLLLEQTNTERLQIQINEMPGEI